MAGNLAVIDDVAIAFLKSRGLPSGLIRVGEPLQPGEKVIIEEGPFVRLVAIVERYFSERERVMVLLTTIKAPLRLDLGVQSVRRLTPSPA